MQNKNMFLTKSLGHSATRLKPKLAYSDNYFFAGEAFKILICSWKLTLRALSDQHK